MNWYLMPLESSLAAICSRDNPFKLGRVAESDGVEFVHPTKKTNKISINNFFISFI